jgi:peroxiredoxin
LARDNAVTLKELFEDRTVALFGVPAPFTGTCTKEHYPGYQKVADEILGCGVDEIVCLSVSDPYAMDGWQRSLGNDPSKITFLADPAALFARAYGVAKTYDDTSLGLRSERFSMTVQNGIVTAFRIVQDARTDAEELLQELEELKENKEEAI